MIGEVNYGNDLYGIVATVYSGEDKPITYHYLLFAGGPEKSVGDLEQYATAAAARAAMDAKARALDAESAEEAEAACDAAAAAYLERRE